MIADFSLSSSAAAPATISSLSVQSWPRRVKTWAPCPMMIWTRQPSNFTSVDQSPSRGGVSTRVGIMGSMKPSLMRPPRLHAVTNRFDEAFRY